MADSIHARSASNRQDSVCGVIVTYYPGSQINKQILSILPQVDALVIIDNTPANAGLQQENALDLAGENTHIIRNNQNIGQAAALNQGLEYALQSGCRWTLTLDQDTECHADMVETLIRSQKECAENCIIIGANYFDPQLKRYAIRPASNTSCIERKTVITSGSMVDTHLVHLAGGFRSEFFIDQVDHELCLRMRAQGYGIAICQKPVMSHHVGQTGGATIPFLGTLPNHPPLRKYYITRNTLIMLREHWRREPAWCMRRSIRLILGLILMATLEKQRIKKLRAFSAGFNDGLKHRMGPCKHPWLAT